MLSRTCAIDSGWPTTRLDDLRQQPDRSSRALRSSRRTDAIGLPEIVTRRRRAPLRGRSHSGTERERRTQRAAHAASERRASRGTRARRSACPRCATGSTTCVALVVLEQHDLIVDRRCRGCARTSGRRGPRSACRSSAAPSGSGATSAWLYGSMNDGVSWNVSTPNVCSTTLPTSDDIGSASACVARVVRMSVCVWFGFCSARSSGAMALRAVALHVAEEQRQHVGGRQRRIRAQRRPQLLAGARRTPTVTR